MEDIAARLRPNGIDCPLGELLHYVRPGEAGGKQSKVNSVKLGPPNANRESDNLLIIVVQNQIIGNHRKMWQITGLFSPKAEVTGSNPVGCATSCE
jgi:hypothetical protein